MGRKVVNPPGLAREDLDIIIDLANSLGLTGNTSMHQMFLKKWLKLCHL